MKCKLTEKKSMTAMLIVGLILLIGGFGAARLLPEEQHMATRLAGFVSGIGGAFAICHTLFARDLQISHSLPSSGAMLQRIFVRPALL